jgi:hypothetical protein
MKIKTLAAIFSFLLLSLSLPSDGDSKGGGGVGRGFSRGGKSFGSFRSGHTGRPSYYPGYMPRSGTYYGGGGAGFYLGLGGYWGAGIPYYAPTGCYSCHPSLSWYDRFRNCTYTNMSSQGVAEGRTLTDQDIQTWKSWKDRDPYVGP